jgi:hypothetical protein
MAEALGVTASIAGIVGFGLQLATTLQTYVESATEAEEQFRDIALDINSTASALKQLQEIVDTDKAAGPEYSKPRIFKDEGIREIEVMAVECHKVYIAIVIFVTKAGTAGGKGKVSVTSTDLRMFKASCLISSTLGRKAKWQWLEPRIKRCQDKLRWLKMNLLFNLQLASLARLQIELVTLFFLPQFSVYIKIVLLTFRSTTERVPGSFDEELAVRAIAQQLRQKRIKYAKKLVAKKAKKDDEINSLSGSDVDANVYSFADSPKTQTRRETNDISKGEMLDKIFGRTVGESDKFEEIEW